MASLTKITWAKRENRDRKKLVRRQRRLRIQQKKDAATKVAGL